MDGLMAKQDTKVLFVDVPGVYIGVQYLDLQRFITSVRTVSRLLIILPIHLINCLPLPQTSRDSASVRLSKTFICIYTIQSIQ